MKRKFPPKEGTACALEWEDESRSEKVRGRRSRTWIELCVRSIIYSLHLRPFHSGHREERLLSACHGRGNHAPLPACVRRPVCIVADATVHQVRVVVNEAAITISKQITFCTAETPPRVLTPRIISSPSELVRLCISGLSGSCHIWRAADTFDSTFGDLDHVSVRRNTPPSSMFPRFHCITPPYSIAC